MLSVKLRELRKKNRLSQAELGEALGLTNNAISKYECATNNPDPDTLCRFADFFEVSVDYLLGRTDEDNIKTVREEIPLSDDEAQMLEAYRKCSPDGKQYILGQTLVVSVVGPPVVQAQEKAATTQGDGETKDTGRLLA